MDDAKELQANLGKIMNARKLEAFSLEMVVGEIKAKQEGVHRHQNFLFPYYDIDQVSFDYKWTPNRPLQTDLPEGHPRPNVAIIVVAYNCWGHTKACLESIYLSHTYNFRVILVDNGSNDGTTERAEAFHEARKADGYQLRLDVITLEENLGLSAGLNEALKSLDPAEDVIVLNNDIIVTPYWVEGLVKAAYLEDDTGVVGCRLRGIDGKIHHAGALLKRNFVGETNLWGREMPDTNTYAGRWYPRIIMFSCAYIPRKALDVLGKFDESYFAYFEDSDTCLRLEKAGLKVIYDGSVELIHHHGVTTRENKMDFGSIFDTSRKRFLKKWQEYEEDRMNQDPIVIRGFTHGLGGYCRFTRELVRALDMARIPIWTNEPLINVNGRWTHEPVEENALETTDHLRQMEIDDPSIGRAIVNVSIPMKWIRIPEEMGGNRLNIGYTMLEVDGAPDDWVAWMNSMDGLLVPTVFNEATFRKSGTAPPIGVVPAAVNTNFFHPDVRPMKTVGGTFRVMSCFEWGERKGPELLLQAAGEAAQVLRKTGVELELILRCGSRVFEYTDEIAAASRKYDFQISTMSKSFPELVMPSMYRAAHLFVLPTKGEGFGMPIAEAMACGVPVVTTPCSAVGTFFDEDVGYPVNWEWGPAKALCSYYNSFNWAEPDPDHLRAQILKSYHDISTDSPELRAKLERARERVVTFFSYEAVAEQFKAAMVHLFESNGKEPPKWAVPR